MTVIRILFATDIHGSERCFRKFINAGKLYRANAIVMGGDITGKVVVPFVRQEDGSYQIDLYGLKRTVKKAEEVEQIEKETRVSGYYPYYTTQNELEALNHDPRMVDELFSKLMLETSRRWLDFAEERLRDSSIRCFITPGNDDRAIIDQIFKESKNIVNPEGKVIELQGYEFISTGYTNPTPWNTAREVTETELSQKIMSMVKLVREMKTCIFNFHSPPYDSGIDDAMKLDEELRPVPGPGGQPLMVPVGSKSVRDAIEKFQPLLGLHGHIHESRGVVKLGRTLCVNPGSEYNIGLLRAAIVDLEEGKVKNYQLVAG